MIDLVIAGVQHPHFRYYLDSVADRDDARVVAFSEADQATREAVAAETGLQAYADHRELIEATKPTVVGVAAEFGSHGTIVLDALGADCHVLADKPLCTRLSELEQIEQAVARTDKLLSVMFEKRGYGPSLLARKLYEEGELGEITLVAASGPHKLNEPTRPDWFWSQETYGGVLADLTTHDADMFLWFTGATSGTVTGRAANLGVPEHPEFEDTGLAMVTADGPGGATGAMGALEVHWSSPKAAPWHGDYRMRLTGTKGTAELLWRTGELFVATDTREPELITCEPNRSAAAYFLDALIAGEEPSITAADSIAATRIALLAQDSAANGGELRRWQR